MLLSSRRSRSGGSVRRNRWSACSAVAVSLAIILGAIAAEAFSGTAPATTTRTRTMTIDCGRPGASPVLHAVPEKEADAATTTGGGSGGGSTFDVDTALFCAGLAFDAYVEPDPDSSRWERGVSLGFFRSCSVLFRSVRSRLRDRERHTERERRIETK